MMKTLEEYKKDMDRHFPLQGSEFSEDQKSIFFDFAYQYPEEIRNIRNDAIKSLMLNKHGLNHFLAADVTLIFAMPASYKNEDEKKRIEEERKKAIEEYVKDKRYLIITLPNLQGADKRALDSYKEKYPGQCIRLSTYHFQPIKDILAIAGKASNDGESKSTLVFIGPTLGNSPKIANCDASQISECVKSHGNIKEVELMGYNTAGIRGSVEDKESLLGRVAGEFSKNQIQGVTIRAYKGEGYSYAKIPSISSSPTFFGSPTQGRRSPMPETVSEVSYTP
ncbi:hypothetical protein ACQUW5_06270 [Legionella sp. CNM-1927-20]|uniref:hypothetical protein n=1 Tax=Legionella sp. CNM-1927-20 TaxID=3422221 RepID=UPI00403AEB99